MHGYNTRFEEAVYRFAQIVHDAHVDVAPVLFTWPSGGNAVDYVYDRDSAMYSRDALETVLQALTKNPNVGSISILAHSMGNYLTVEALRQMSIRDHGLPPKIRDVMLASPDIDVDVFRRQIAEIDAEPRATQFTLFVSRDDKALGLSSFLARDSTRLGALDPTKEPYSSMLEQARVNVVDLTNVASNDSANHSKFATGEVVAAIGDRLAEGQALSDAKAGPGRIARRLHRRRDRHGRQRRHRRGHRPDAARRPDRDTRSPSTPPRTPSRSSDRPSRLILL